MKVLETGNEISKVAEPTHADSPCQNTLSWCSTIGSRIGSQLQCVKVAEGGMRSLVGSNTKAKTRKLYQCTAGFVTYANVEIVSAFVSFPWTSTWTMSHLLLMMRPHWKQQQLSYLKQLHPKRWHQRAQSGHKIALLIHMHDLITFKKQQELWHVICTFFQHWIHNVCHFDGEKRPNTAWCRMVAGQKHVIQAEIEDVVKLALNVAGLSLWPFRSKFSLIWLERQVPTRLDVNFLS